MAGCGVVLLPQMERLEDKWYGRAEQQLMGRQQHNFQTMQQAVTAMLLADEEGGGF